MSKILIVDDDAGFLKRLNMHLQERYPELAVETCTDPVKCLSSITTDLDLLLVDLEMPGLDGTKVLSYATSIGVDKNRIIILSGRDSDYLHKKFPMGSCLGVLNKFEENQKAVLDMIFNALRQKKSVPSST